MTKNWTEIQLVCPGGHTDQWIRWVRLDSDKMFKVMNEGKEIYKMT